MDKSLIFTLVLLSCVLACTSLQCYICASTSSALDTDRGCFSGVKINSTLLRTCASGQTVCSSLYEKDKDGRTVSVKRDCSAVASVPGLECATNKCKEENRMSGSEVIGKTRTCCCIMDQCNSAHTLSKTTMQMLGLFTLTILFH